MLLLPTGSHLKPTYHPLHAADKTKQDTNLEARPARDARPARGAKHVKECQKNTNWVCTGLALGYNSSPPTSGLISRAFCREVKKQWLRRYVTYHRQNFIRLWAGAISRRGDHS